MSDACECKLTVREVKVLFHVSQGCTDQEIAVHLNIGVRTVQRHLSNIYQKLEVRNRVAAVKLVIEMGWLTSS